MHVPKRKQTDVICVVAIVFGLILTILFMNGERLGLTTTIDADSEAHSDDEYFTANDLNANWDTSKATTITLEGNSVRVSGMGAYAYDGGAVIANSGTYVVSGELTDGSLTVDANDNSKVWILLDGVTITNEDDAALVVDQADKVFLTLAEGSTNTLTSGATFSEAALEDNTDGAIFAHDDLTINGSGSLVVVTGYGHGISANDDLVIAGGSVDVTAPKDGIHANDSLRVADAALEVTAEDDGLVADNEGAYLYVESGTVVVAAGDEGMVAVGDATIAGGEITVSAGTESGHHGIKAGGTCTITGGTISIPTCYEGIQANYIDVQGGDVVVYPADDGLNASSGTTQDMGGMPGGGMGAPGGGRMQAGEQPADGQQTDGQAAQDGQPQGGRQGRGPGGMPGGSQMPGGNTGDTTQDGMAQPDAATQPNSDVEATEPSVDDTQTNTAQPNGDTQQNAISANATDEELPWIHVSGGSVLVVNQTAQDADGLDSNGDIIISGGEIRVSLTGSGSNNAIDYGSESGGVCEISGGTVVACGSSAMAESVSDTSAQASILYNTSTAFDAGQTVCLEDAEGNVLLSYEVPCSFSSALVSCSQMVQGQTYRIAVGDTVEEVTLDSMAKSAGDAQSAMPGGGQGMGGGMGGHGMGDRGTSGTSADSGAAVPNGAETANSTDADVDMGGGMPQDGGRPPTDETNDQTSTDEAAVSATATPKEYTAETLMICAASIPILLIGLFIAFRFQRR